MAGLYDSDDPGFMPSVTVRKAMTYVNGDEIGYGSRSHGLFHDGHSYERDIGFLLAALCGEAYFAFLALRFGISYFWMYVIATLVIDIGLAILYHRLRCKRLPHVRQEVCGHEAQLKVGATADEIKDETNRLRKKYSDVISKNLLLSQITGLFIVGLFFIKLYGVFVLNRSDISSRFFWLQAVGLLLLLAVHILFTGNACSYIWAKGFLGLFGYSKEHKRHAAANKGSTYASTADGYAVAINPSLENGTLTFPLDSNQHQIVELNGKYEMKTFGLLYNEDIKVFARKFKNQSNINAVIESGLYLQGYRMGVSK